MRRGIAARRGFVARRVLVASVVVLPLAVLIALLTTGVMSKGMLEGPGWVALAQCLHPWTDGGSDLYPCQNENVIVGASSQANADHLLLISGTAIFNEQGADADCRIEGDADANLIYTDASADRVGIGTSSPACKLDVVKSGGGLVTTNCVLAANNNSASGSSCDVNILGGTSGTSGLHFGNASTNPSVASLTVSNTTGQAELAADTTLINGGQKVKRTAVTASATVGATDYHIGVVPNGADVVLTLPSAAAAGNGKVYVFKRETSVTTYSIDFSTSGGETIDGLNDPTGLLDAAWSAITIISDGTNWFIMSNKS